MATVWVFVWKDPLQRFGSGSEPDPEPTRRFGSVSNTMDRNTTVRWIPISLEIYISRMLLVRKDWRIRRILFAWRKLRLTGYQSKGIGRREHSEDLSREKRSQNEQLVR